MLLMAWLQNFLEESAELTTCHGSPEADSFNTWGLNKEDTAEKQAFAEILPAPKNFYLVNLLNCFGAHGGFELVLWYGTQPHLPLKRLRNRCPVMHSQRCGWPTTPVNFVNKIRIRTSQ
ncbi:hypothetical protein ACTXT7_001967 [Hymenolepis weldensis]